MLPEDWGLDLFMIFTNPDLLARDIALSVHFDLVRAAVVVKWLGHIDMNRLIGVRFVNMNVDLAIV